jgi:PAS domain S-box-containing protein
MARSSLRSPLPLARGDVEPSRLKRLLDSAEQLGEMGTWEQDLRTRGTVWSRGIYRILGIEPRASVLSAEEILEYIHPGDRVRMAAVLGAIEHGPDGVDDRATVEFRVVRPDGSVRDIRARGHFEHGADGRPARWTGSLHDVTGRRLAERSLAVHHGVSRAMAEWGGFEGGVVDLLRRIGAPLGYCVGSLWTLDVESDRLTCRAFWSESGLDASEFEAVSRRTSFAPGTGVPGQAWLSRQPITIEDLAREPRLVGRDAAGRLGLASSLAFPVHGSPGPLGVLSFYSLDRRPPNEWLDRTLTEVGHALGSFLAPRLGDLGHNRLTPREIEVLNLAAEGNSGPDIAKQLVLSPGTVKTHFEHIYEKLGVGDRAAAVALGLRTGLIQ